MNDHLATWAAETATSEEEQRWFAWIAEAQRLAGHDLDGDEREDGYSLDVAHQAFRDGKTARDYILTIPADALVPGGSPELSEWAQTEHAAPIHRGAPVHRCEDTPDAWPCKKVLAVRAAGPVVGGRQSGKAIPDAIEADQRLRDALPADDRVNDPRNLA